jgi:FkbM family methyltransferase
MPPEPEGGNVVSELWCSQTQHEASASGLCRLPWHVVAPTFLVFTCGAAGVVAAGLAAVVRTGRGTTKSRRSRSTLALGCAAVAAVALAACLSMTQSVWIGTDTWPAPWYLGYARLAIWSGWYRFGLSSSEVSGRKVYIDVGARYYNTSCLWFKEHYPHGGDFQIVAFEVEPRFRKYFSDHPEVELHSVAVGTKEGTVSFDFGMAHTESGDKCERCNEVPVIDFATFLKKRFTVDDYVVAKIDVEGSEYDLFNHLLETGSAALIDELFVEWHGWRFTKQWEQIAILQQRLRDEAGVVRMHYWL